ncbi:MAG: DNA-binding response regulator [Verrucomicrobia bacterium]|nr:DNA-binding response regulator [Verrucomicrobiota bacterium]
MRILVVEDSVRLQRVLTTALRKSGYVMDLAGDGEEGLWLAETNNYDIIILDIMLPKRDGLSLMAEYRKKGGTAHILLLTARDTVANRVEGLHAGADDYLIKPFALEELLARVQTLGRRAYGSKQNEIVIGDLVINVLARSVRIGDKVIDLTARDYLLLEYLARRRGTVVSRAEIEEHIYDSSGDRMSNVVDSAICALRRKLMDDAKLIHTRRGMGYVLEVQPAGAVEA